MAESGAGRPEGLAISRPGKVMRIQTMTHKVLDELRELSLGPEARTRLAGIFDESIRELSEVLALDERNELTRLVEAFDAGRAPSGPELRIADAQLAGWLDGLVRTLESTIVLEALAEAKAQQPDGDTAAAGAWPRREFL